MTEIRGRILYVDDDDALGHLVRNRALKRGFELMHVRTMAEGLAAIGPGIDVVALDHHLPEGTGLDVLHAVKGRAGVPPIIYVTGSDDVSVAVHALKAGATDYVTKAVSDDFLELLFSAIEQALEQKKLATQKLETERELREARDRAETLLREVNHRVANSLSLVASMVRMQASALRDMGAKAALTETEARIIAIAGVHRRLYTSPDVRTVDLSAYLDGLVRELEQSLKAAGHSTHIRLESEPIEAATDKAVSLGVIVTEMVTNAYKYAYHDTDGEVRIKLSRAEGETAELRVEDDGIGWDGHGTPKGTGVGTKIIRAMAENLGSAVSYNVVPRGTCARLIFAL